MDSFQLWKLATDVALILSVLYLSMRFMRSQGSSVDTRELRDLEIVLKTLLKDADVASRSLSDSLGRRQQSLERILAELDGGERRIASSLRSAEEMRLTLERVTAAGRMATAATPHAASKTADIPLTRRVEVATDAVEEWAEPPSFDTPRAPVPSRRSSAITQAPTSPDAEEIGQPRRTGAAAYQSVATQTTAAAPRSEAQYNIFGERLDSEAPQKTPARADRPRLPRQPLADEIEIERVAPPKMTPPPSRRKDRAEVQDIYEAAERLLKAGEDLETVSAATRLPLDEVRKLSQIMVSSEKAAIPASPIPAAMTPAPQSGASVDPAADPRLGVFASIRRQTQVL